MTASTGEFIDILIADDHNVVREGLVAIINRQPDLRVVAEASDGLAAVAQFKEKRPDVTLMDLHMPELDGVAAIRSIRTVDPDARVLALTSYDGDAYIYDAIQFGARGFLLKTLSSQELTSAIRTVAAGKRVIPSDIGEKLSRRMLRRQLTPREADVLACIVNGCSNQEISQRLQITLGTVKSYVHSVLAKLGVKDRTAAATMALREGLCDRTIS